MAEEEKPSAEAAPEETTEGAKPEAPQPARSLFGTFQGVFIPSILTILGVVMYLRLGWVVGEAGIVLTIVIVTLASSITFITGLSIAATATNMRVKGGGAYFMVSRSFGLESGAAIGLPLFLAQATGVSFYLAGFAESLHVLLPGVPSLWIGLVALVVLGTLALVSANLALKLQIFIFAVILVSLLSLFAGSPIVDPLAGSTGPSLPDAPSLPFWVIFAVFFPAVTGIEAGISMSGELKSPRRSLPLGTISAIVTGYVVYLFIPIFLWMYAPRAALRGNPLVMWDIAILPQAIYAGIWGATLSSALGAILGGARTLQALALDRVVPRFVAPPGNFGLVLATIITGVIAAAGLYAGSLDAIAPVLSMFFLTSYGALNLIAGLEGLIGNPSWRPTFHTPWRLSMLGALLCIGTMLMIDAGASMLAIVACSSVYAITRWRQVRSGWSDIRGGILQALARYSVYSMGKYQDVARTWRPNILLFSGSPTARWYLVQLADAITQGKGFLTVCTVIERKAMDEEKVRALERSVQDYLGKQRVPALVRVKFAENFHAGALGLIADYGLGHIEPNTVMLGETEKAEEAVDYCRMLIAAFRQRKNLLIVRDQTHQPDAGLDEDDKDRTIDVWFTAKSPNSNLMLIVAYMLQSSPEWRGATLTVKALVPNEDSRRSMQEGLEEFLKTSRIEAGTELYVQRPALPVLQEVGRYSTKADVVFIGMRPPEEEETPEAYAAYYRSLMEETRGYPLTVIVLAGEVVDFEEVFS